MGRARSIARHHSLALALALSGLARLAQADDGGNDVCPAMPAEADDVRAHYDATGRLVRQLRLLQNRYVQEVSIRYDGDHAVVRSEATPGQLREARTRWDGDRVSEAECFVNGKRTARAVYRYYFDEENRVIATEIRDGAGRVLSVIRAERETPPVPIVLELSAGGAYQSDTELYDFTAGLGVHRTPPPDRYASDPLDVKLDGSFKYHRAAGLTSTDQTLVRFSADYHDIVPRLTLFTFTNIERNLPANLRLNLEEALLGAKLEILRGTYQLDASFAPVWNYRSINAPRPADDAVDADAEPVVEDSSRLRGSFRIRAGIHQENWSLLDTFEALPTLYGDDVIAEDDLWQRTLLRNTLALEVKLLAKLSLREELKYTRDPALVAQANCPESDSPLCKGYSLASTTSLVLNLEL
ncbi:MAG: hypothetical protein M3020_16310 [Myxococcota bacterium]|nr:hypothetical protein [Myxococcota bacterium]